MCTFRRKMMFRPFMPGLGLILILLVSGGRAADWSYHGPTGPSNWSDIFPQYCAGTAQSPINIDTVNAMPSDALPLEFNGYSKDDIPDPSQMDLTNNGHTVQVTLSGDFNIKGGPLKATYQAAQLHFHWGRTDLVGSEHKLDGLQYPAEMHIVHWDRDNYESFDEAVMYKNGLAVLGVFIEVGNVVNPTFDEIVQAIDRVKFKGDTYTFTEVFALDGLLPDVDNLGEYFYYEGSLTTPTCDEVIQWIVYRKPIEITSQQLAALRTVHENEMVDGVTNTTLVDNFRPTQPLNMRTVYVASSSASFGGGTLWVTTVLSIVMLVSSVNLSNTCVHVV